MQTSKRTHVKTTLDELVLPVIISQADSTMYSQASHARDVFESLANILGVDRAYSPPGTFDTSESILH